MSRRIIRKIRLAHCKKGPLLCEKCREMNVEKICLLETFPPGMGMAQRRMIQVERDGEEVWREFEIVTAFDSEGEAREYAARNGIDDMEF